MTIKSLDLSAERFSKAPTQPPVLRPVSNAALKGKLPLKPGDIVLTANEKLRLNKLFGWKDGDPLPGDIATRIASARKEIAQDMREAKQPQDHPGLQIKRECDIRELDPAKQRELTKELKKFKELAPQIEAAAKNPTAQLTPSMQKALAEAGEGIQIVDSGDPIKGLQQQIDAAEGKIRATEAEDSGLEEEEDTRAPMALPAACPRCGQDLNTQIGEPDDHDKLAYVTAVLGGMLLSKTYTLFGGRVSIEFRQLSTEQAERVFEQVAKEIKQGATTDPYRQALTYRMILSLVSIEINGEKDDYASQVEDFLAGDCASGDHLPELVQAIRTSGQLKTESMWRACRDCYTRFNNMLDELDSRADNSDFWTAIES